MSYFNYLVSKMKGGLITFLNMVILANRDYPYHDHETATMTATKVAYKVGENNRASDGSQAKLFVSKSMLVIATTDAIINLNSPNNVDIPIRALNFYEFKGNIRNVYYRYDAEEGTIDITPEGVLPDEARSEHF